MKYYAVIQKDGEDYTVLRICHTKESLAKALLLHKSIHAPDTIASVFGDVLTGEFREIDMEL